MNKEHEFKKDGKEESPKPAGSENAQDQAGSVTLPNKEYQELLARLSELEALKDRLFRSAADYENSKKRLLKEREEFVKYGQENLIRELLPVLDNFERALSHLEDSPEAHFKNIAAGIRMVFKQLLEILKNQGLNRLKAVGETFDPHRHEAVGFVHGPGQEDEVVEEIEPGYLLYDRLLRAAKVRVRAPDPSSQRSASETSEQEKSEEIT